jgi:hypothetical protein
MTQVWTDILFSERRNVEWKEKRKGSSGGKFYPLANSPLQAPLNFKAFDDRRDVNG